MAPLSELGYGYEPHDHIYSGSVRHGGMVQPVRWGGGVPGVVEDRVAGRGAIPVPTRHPPGPIFNIFKPQGPTYGQMKANLRYSMRFPRMGLDMGPEMTRIDPESTSRDHTQTGPEMPSDPISHGPQISYGPE